jgi:hypothetical protein
MRKNLLEIANLPKERKLWLLRKFYAGNGGCLPPTDPRVLNMTDELIDLEFMHMYVDKQNKDGESYEDEDYDEYDKETDEHDNKLSDISSDIAYPSSEVTTSTEDTVKSLDNKDDWEDVEIDDF